MSMSTFIEHLPSLINTTKPRHRAVDIVDRTIILEQLLHYTTLIEQQDVSSEMLASSVVLSRASRTHNSIPKYRNNRTLLCGIYREIMRRVGGTCRSGNLHRNYSNKRSKQPLRSPDWNTQRLSNRNAISLEQR